MSNFFEGNLIKEKVTHMALTVKQLEAAKPKSRLYRISDERGLYLEVPPTGNKRWRFRYRFDGKAKMISLGRYPEIQLADARKARERYREMVEKGVNPAVKRKEAEEAVEGETFKSVFKEWFFRNKSTWTKKHSTTITSRIKNNVLPWLGDKPISQIEPPEILQVLRRIESRGAIETAHRVKGIISQVFRFAVASGLAQRDQAADLKDALAPVKVVHHPSITDPNKIGPLLRAMWGYEGHHVTRCALKLVVLTFVRSSELRFAEWSEVDFESSEWRIPAERMKARRPHIVPLSKQSIEVFQTFSPHWKREIYFPFNPHKLPAHE